MNDVAREELKKRFDSIYTDKSTIDEFLEECVNLTIEVVSEIVNTILEINNLNNVILAVNNATPITPSLDWLPINTATKDINCGEILGCRIHNDVMIREPFITFWSPTLQMYYCDPTHWIAMPTMPVITPVNTEVKEQFIGAPC